MLRLLMAGKSNKQIAAALFISEGTVENTREQHPRKTWRQRPYTSCDYRLKTRPRFSVLIGLLFVQGVADKSRQTRVGLLMRILLVLFIKNTLLPLPYVVFLIPPFPRLLSPD